jgi:hypothetical protein
MRTIEIHATEHPSASDALTELNFSGEVAFTLGGRHFTATSAELDRIERLGIQPTIRTWNHACRRCMSVPGKH